MKTTDVLPIAEVAKRSGFPSSALRFYEKQGLIASSRTAGGQRRYERNVLRRLAFIRAARNVGLSLDEIAAALATLPAGRTPTRADWAQLSRSWRTRLDEQIEALQALRDGLESCIGCGCLSLKRCAISNPGDVAGVTARGAAYLPGLLRSAVGSHGRNKPLGASTIGGLR
jgi:MerR family redox-sensitive transcriptional activator SoxR